MAYCKYFNDECYAPFCSAYPHSFANPCLHIVASEEELERIGREAEWYNDFDNKKNGGDEKTND